MSQTKREKKEKNIFLQILGKIGTLTVYFKFTMLPQHVTLEWYMLITINAYNNSNMAKGSQLLWTQLAVNIGWPMSLGKVCDKYFKVRNQVNILRKKKRICYGGFCFKCLDHFFSTAEQLLTKPNKIYFGN